MLQKYILHSSVLCTFAGKSFCSGKACWWQHKAAPYAHVQCGNQAAAPDCEFEECPLTVVSQLYR